METLKQILTRHLSLAPAMHVQDLYKLLYQAALGSEHAVYDEQAARDWLLSELAAMGPGPSDPLTDPISPDGNIIRVHLRPYVASGKDPQTLLKAFFRTANEWRSSPGKLNLYGKSACRLADAGLLPFSGESVQTFFSKMEDQGYPAVHHSGIYKRLYHPAYRVISRWFMEEI